MAVWKVPSTLYTYVPEEKDRAGAEASTRTGMIAGLAGLAALGGLAVTARTYRLTQQGQLTDRYTKAIAQLRDDKLDVRLGGIYALERLASDSRRDHPVVVEVLSAFVRDRTDPPRPDKPTVAEVLQTLFGKPSDTPPPATAPLNTPAFDIQAARTVLGRLPTRLGTQRRANLIGADLTGANLSMANLTQADLTAVNLTEANLDGANLTRAWFRGAILIEANHSAANLTEARRLTQSQLDSACGDGWCPSAPKPKQVHCPDQDENADSLLILLAW